mgnify:FL=1
MIDRPGQVQILHKVNETPLAQIASPSVGLLFISYRFKQCHSTIKTGHHFTGHPPVSAYMR